MWAHREVLLALARTDFKVRYKRASFGIAWAVVLPLIQALVLAFVFSRVIGKGRGSEAFGAYVLIGVVAWSYFGLTLGAAATSIVDGSGLTDKVWFPRALLPLSSAVANLIGLAISVGLAIILTPVLGGHLGIDLLLLIPGALLLVAFTASLSLVLAALHVYFRDVRFIVQAALLVWFYVTPIMYPATFLKDIRFLIDINPMTGIVEIFHAATVGANPGAGRAIVSSVVVTVVLVLIAMQTYRRYDRLFVDQL